MITAELDAPDFDGPAILNLRFIPPPQHAQRRPAVRQRPRKRGGPFPGLLPLPADGRFIELEGPAVLAENVSKRRQLLQSDRVPFFQLIRAGAGQNSLKYGPRMLKPSESEQQHAQVLLEFIHL